MRSISCTLLVSLAQQLGLFGRNDDIADGHGDGAAGGILVAHGLDIVQHLGADIHAVHAEAVLNDVAQILLDNLLVDFQLEHIVHGLTGLEAQILGNVLVEDQLAQGAVDHTALRHALEGTVDTHLNGRLQSDLMRLIGHERFVLIGKDAARADGRRDPQWSGSGSR